MAQSRSVNLDSNDPFPYLELKLTDGRSISLPADMSGKWTILLIYRGYW